MKLLLISNSTMPGEAYLDYPKNEIRRFLGEKPATALFIPFAAVTFSYDEYEQKVQERFNEIGHTVKSIHHFDNPAQAVKEAGAIVVGGGNTWQLVRKLHELKLMELMRDKILGGCPYIGWSAGSNIACPTLRTTNDMPIVDPLNFNTMGLVPFQINPHYLDANPEGHGGETRQQRIEEFIAINPGIYVVGLREGTMFWVENDSIKLLGNRTARLFKNGEEHTELPGSSDLSFLLG